MRVVVVAAHPDDETLGCGGALLRHRCDGDEVHWLLATSRQSPRWSSAAVADRQRQVVDVSRDLGFTSVTELDHQDGSLDTVPMTDLIAEVDDALGQVRPDVVYVVHGGDAHTDHSILHRATMSALKAFRMRALGVRRILAYETLSSTEASAAGGGNAFLPTVFTDITGHLNTKLAVMDRYGSELQDELLPRSRSAIVALARLRGATVGVLHAEAFALLRELG